jgi:hypothetical protein
MDLENQPGNDERAPIRTSNPASGESASIPEGGQDECGSGVSQHG